MLHGGLTAERWARFPRFDQLLMVGTELKRFQHWNALEDAEAAGRCLDRALELLDLSVAVSAPGRARRELCRAREVLRNASGHPAVVRELLHALVGDA